MCGKSSKTTTLDTEVAPGVVAYEINGVTRYFKAEAVYDEVSLAACRADGTRLTAGHIVSITKDGELRIEKHLTDKAGLKLSDKAGRISVLD
jgi:hypothetical protein